MNAFTTYLLFSAENVGVAAIILALVLALAGGAMLLAGYVEDIEPLRRPAKMALAWALVALVVAVVVPDRKTVMAMMVLPYVTQNEQISQLPENAAAALNKLLQEYAKH